MEPKEISPVRKAEAFGRVTDFPDIHQVRTRYWNCQDRQNKLVVVIDDDPTGIQTVQDIYVYTMWSEDILLDIFRKEQLVYLQTNSRSLTRDKAVRVNREIAGMIIKAWRETGRDFSVISRSDSSLRGHYPDEPLALKEILEAEPGLAIDGEIIVPFFPEAGRFTLDDVHYIAEGDLLVPVSGTEFAGDAVFGFRNADLKLYIEEKSGGKYNASDVTPVSLETLRSQNLPAIEETLLRVEGFRKVIVNALCYEDLMVFVMALLEAERKGKRFIFRTAAAFVKVYGFIATKPVLTMQQLGTLSGAGAGVLVIVGSHTQKTSRQLSHLLEREEITAIEVYVDALLASPAVCQREIEDKLRLTETALVAGKNPVLFTSRTLVTAAGGKEENLVISNTVSSSLTEIVRRLSIRPRCLISKGGITSSDIVAKGLKIGKARVVGQALSGVPVILAGDQSKWPGLPVVIFPGNVGDDEALWEVYQKVCPPRQE